MENRNTGIIGTQGLFSFIVRSNDLFDWYQRFYSFQQPIKAILPINAQTSILIPGCGNSRLPEQMIEQGYSNITCIDHSAICIKNMTERYKQKNKKINFECMDVRHLAFENQSFDAIVDKALFDCIMCSQYPLDNAYKTLCEFNRVLKKKGVYFLLSYDSPLRRLPLLQKSQFEWVVRVQKISKLSLSIPLQSIIEGEQQANCYYLYICIKK